MEHSSQRTRVSDRNKKLNALRAKLRDALLPSVIRADWVTREIERFLARWRNKPAIRRLIAQQLARHLVSKWPFASTQCVEPSIETEIHAVLKQGDITPAAARQIAERLITKWRFASINAIEQLIENKPELLDQVVMASTVDEMHRIFKATPALPQSKQKRAKPSSDEERARRLARAKRRYDRHRAYKATRIGLIEQEFGEHNALLRNPFLAAFAVPHLDSLLTGGEVQMSTGVSCMKDLFGFDRHKFPKSITRIPRGTKVFYDLHSVMQCMVVFLDAQDPEQRWLAVPRRRQLVLTGIIKRAQDIGTKKVAEFVTKTLQPYLR